MSTRRSLYVQSPPAAGPAAAGASNVAAMTEEPLPAAAPVSATDDTVRGVTNRSKEAWALFRDLARGDFKHDFGEREKTRDLIVGSDESRFFDIAKQVSKKGSVWLRTQFRNYYIDQTLFALFGNNIDNILPPVPAGIEPNQAFYDEVGLLQTSLGIDFEGIKADVMNKAEGESWDATFQTGGITRQYTLRSANYRRGPKVLGNQEAMNLYKTNQNITTIFNTVTGGKGKFVLIVDASGGLPLTDLLNTELGPDPVPGSQFYIVENIENMSDSATKLSGLKPRGPAGRDEFRPQVFFLRDTANTVVYPLWENYADPKSNVFSSMKIILNRITDNEVEADLLFVYPNGTEEIIHIGDVANSSNVKNATLRALATYIEKGIVPEALAYTLIKRMGDWCQALSMLDLDRAYEILNTDRSPTASPPTLITLRDMMVDSEIGVVTNDRILLGVCILLGLNVFFTTGMDVAKVIYFKNNNDVPPGGALLARIGEIFASLPQPPPTPYVFVAALDPQLPRVVNERDLPEYIFQLKCILSNIGNIRNEYDTYASQIDYNQNIYTNESSTPIQKFNAVNALASIYAKIVIDNNHNEKLIQNIANGVYEDSPQDRIRIEALKRKLSMGGRITKSVEVTEAKNILLSVRDDIQLILGKNIPGTIEILNQVLNVDRFTLAEDDRKKTNYDEILSVLPAIRLVIPASLVGGGRQTGGERGLDDILTALTARSVRLIPEAEAARESTSTVNIYVKGGDYIDEKLRRYTVSDQFIVTEDDMTTFDVFFSFPPPPESPPPEIIAMIRYVCLKYLLLQLDICHNALENIDEERTEVLEPGSVEYERYADYYGRILDIQSIGSDNILNTNVIYDSIKTYKSLAREGISLPTPDERRTLTTDVRTSLINAIIPLAPPLSPEENLETETIENTFAAINLRIGRFREEIAQEANSNLVLDPVKLQSLGEVIEAAVINEIRENAMDALYTAESDRVPLPDTIPQAIVYVINNWITTTKPSFRKNGSVNAVLVLAYTRATTIVDETNANIQPRSISNASSGLRGGLRKRRSLYSNVGQTPFVNVDGASNDEGLRKRTGSSITRRVRKSTRSTRRRR